jgi:hypothetical protein
MSIIDLNHYMIIELVTSTLFLDKPQLTGQNLGQVFNSRSGWVQAMQLHCFETKLPNLKLKTAQTISKFSPQSSLIFAVKVRVST